MHAFVTGATGYLGFAIASALRRAGYRVRGLVRSEAKARHLVQHEVEPVIGDLADPKTYIDVASECAVLVHTAFDYAADGVAKDRTAIDALLEAGRRGTGSKTLLFTSGAWVYGDTGDHTADETTPPAPVKLVAWRPAHELLVLQATGVRGIVLRPGDVYGGSGGLTGLWFNGPSTGKPPTIVGDGRNRVPMVHLEDLADLYVRVADSGLAGEIFNVTDGSRSTVLEMATAAARAVGYTGEIRPTPLAEARKTMGDFADALALSQRVDSRKAVRRLGWRPSHAGFLDAADLYYRAWRAHQH